MNIFKRISQRFLRWGWLKLTGEDPLIIRNHWKFLEKLNACHCEWIEYLKIARPDLKDEIFHHESERLKICCREVEKND